MATTCAAQADPAPGPVQDVPRKRLDARAFDAFYETHIDFVWRTVRRLGVPEHSLDDVVQAVLLVVFRRLSEFEGRSSLKTWAFEVIVRVVREHRRAMRRAKLGATNDAYVDPSTLTAPAQDRPDALFERQSAARVVRELLDELDDPKREVFVLAELEQLTLQAIADILHEPIGTIASRLRAARCEFERAAKRRRAREEQRR